MEDSRIVELYFLRDESAITHTSEKYGSRLRALADRILNDSHESEECENDTYLETWNTVPPKDPREYFFAFLGKITRHLAIDRLRRKTAQKRSASITELTREMEECIPGQGRVEEEIELEALTEAINGFLGEQPAERRNIFIRRYWFFDSVSEISERYGIGESKVKVTLHRMREGLREHLTKEGWNL